METIKMLFAITKSGEEEKLVDSVSCNPFGAKLYYSADKTNGKIREIIRISRAMSALIWFNFFQLFELSQHTHTKTVICCWLFLLFSHCGSNNVFTFT